MMEKEKEILFAEYFARMASQETSFHYWKAFQTVTDWDS